MRESGTHADILVVSETGLAAGMGRAMASFGLTWLVAARVEDAERLAESGYVPSALLYLSPPDLADADAGARRLHAAFRSSPMLLGTRRRPQKQLFALMAVGADDFVLALYNRAQIGVRLALVVERARARSAAELCVGPLRMYTVTQRVTCRDLLVPMPAQVFRLLRVLMEHANEMVSLEVIRHEAWGHAVANETHTYHEHLSQLRGVFARYGIEWMLQTVRGRGYVLSARSDDGRVSKRRAGADRRVARTKTVSNLNAKLK